MVCGIAMALCDACLLWFGVAMFLCLLVWLFLF